MDRAQTRSNHEINRLGQVVEAVSSSGQAAPVKTDRTHSQILQQEQRSSSGHTGTEIKLGNHLMTDKAWPTDKAIEVAVLCPTAGEYLQMRGQMTEVSDLTTTIPMAIGSIGNRTVLCCISGKGQENTSATASRILESVKPRILVLTGIAGGFPKQKVFRGDVVVAHTVHSCDYGKLIDGTFVRRPNLDFHCDGGLLSYSSLVIAENDSPWRNYIKVPRPDGQKHECSLAHNECYVASSNKVVDDPDHPFYAKVAVAFPEIHAVEMEAIGIAAATRLHQSDRVVQFVMIRGISDEPGVVAASGSTQRTEWRKYASEVAAAFTKRLIEQVPKSMPPESGQSRDDATRDVEADLASYRSWFRQMYIEPKATHVSRTLDKHQTVLTLPPLTAFLTRSAVTMEAKEPPPQSTISFPRKAQHALVKTANILAADPMKWQSEHSRKFPTIEQRIKDDKIELSYGEVLNLITSNEFEGFPFSQRAYALVGEAGLGKSCLLRRLAIESIDKNKVTPIFIDWDEWSRSGSDKLLDYALSGAWMPSEESGLVNPLTLGLHAGTVILFLDGWDEVQNRSLRSGALHNLLRRIEGIPNVNVVIATRPTDTDDLGKGLVPIELGHIAPNHCIAYLEQYSDLNALESSLKDIIFPSSYVGNGLLLTLVAASFRKHNNLPSLRNPSALFAEYFANPLSGFLEETCRNNKRLDVEAWEALIPLFLMLAFHATLAYSPESKAYGMSPFPKYWVSQCAKYLAKTEEWSSSPMTIANLAIHESSILVVVGEDVKFCLATVQDYYCGLALAEYKKTNDALYIGYCTATETGSWRGKVIEGLDLVDWAHSVRQPSCLEALVWQHHILGADQELHIARGEKERPLDSLLDPWKTYIAGDWSKLGAEYLGFLLRVAERVGDLAFAPLLKVLFALWKDPALLSEAFQARFAGSNMGANVYALVPHRAIARVCTAADWNNISLELIEVMSPDDIQMLVPGIIDPFTKAFVNKQIAWERISRYLDRLLTRSTSSNLTSTQRYRLLELALFVETDPSRPSGTSAVRCATALAGIEIQCNPEVLRLFAVVIRLNSFSSIMKTAAQTLLSCYAESTHQLAPEQFQYGPEALGGCLRLRATEILKAEDEDTDKARAFGELVDWLAKLFVVIPQDFYSEFIAEVAMGITAGDMKDILLLLSQKLSLTGASIPDEWLQVAETREDAAWLYL